MMYSSPKGEWGGGGHREQHPGSLAARAEPLFTASSALLGSPVWPRLILVQKGRQRERERGNVTDSGSPTLSVSLSLSRFAPQGHLLVFALHYHIRRRLTA